MRILIVVTILNLKLNCIVLTKLSEKAIFDKLRDNGGKEIMKLLELLNQISRARNAYLRSSKPMKVVKFFITLIISCIPVAVLYGGVYCVKGNVDNSIQGALAGLLGWAIGIILIVVSVLMAINVFLYDIGMISIAFASQQKREDYIQRTAQVWNYSEEKVEKMKKSLSFSAFDVLMGVLFIILTIALIVGMVVIGLIA